MAGGERRARERTQVRERILRAAGLTLAAEGVEAVTMRRVAADVDYTAPVIYQHFGGKDALLAELVRQGYRELAGRMAAARLAVDDDESLAAVAGQYLRFAGEHEHLFEVMNGTTLEAGGRREAAAPVNEVLLALVTGWARRHRVDLDVEDACLLLWGTLYGVATLGRLPTVGRERADRLGLQALHLLLRAWRAQQPPGRAPEQAGWSGPGPGGAVSAPGPPARAGAAPRRAPTGRRSGPAPGPARP
ncbi:TetR/AcrR family transcriptional regulator [Kineococcus sp. LSe6-4]|uniref:TetR/AcrR family transcriptional regulator n=1 Tax=Kineococcus halophytocola TaxID=3234027 RepID=A0ABV4H169_9ACTN